MGGAAKGGFSAMSTGTGSGKGDVWGLRMKTQPERVRYQPRRGPRQVTSPMAESVVSLWATASLEAASPWTIWEAVSGPGARARVSRMTSRRGSDHNRRRSGSRAGGRAGEAGIGFTGPPGRRRPRSRLPGERGLRGWCVPRVVRGAAGGEGSHRRGGRGAHPRGLIII